MDTRTGTDLGYLQNGVEIVLGVEDARNLSVRAQADAQLVGSVVFMDGSEVKRTENAAPFSLGGDVAADLLPEYGLARTGSYQIGAIPFSCRFAQGLQGQPKNVSFSIRLAPGPLDLNIESLSLVDLRSGLPVPGFDPIPIGAEIPFADLPEDLGVLVTAPSNSVKSVSFQLAEDSESLVDSTAPYLFSVAIDRNPSGTAQNKTVTLSAKAYSGTLGTGISGDVANSQLVLRTDNHQEDDDDHENEHHDNDDDGDDDDEGDSWWPIPPGGAFNPSNPICCVLF